MNEETYDIYKASGIIIQDRKVLATRSKGKLFFIQPGGKLELGETEIDAVIRELREELDIVVKAEDLEKIGDYYAYAAGQDNKKLKLSAYLVKKFEGIPVPSSEVEEIRSFGSIIPEGTELASILEHDIIPELKSRNLID